MNIGAWGKIGEDKVAAFLRKRGFAILKRNFQCRFGEIDIIAETKEYIVFIEVKTRKYKSLVSGIEAVDSHKQKRIMLTAQDYLSKTNCIKQPRFDVAQVTVFQKENGENGYRLNYIENAF